MRLLHVATIPETHWCFLRGQNTFMRERGFEVHVACRGGPLLEQIAIRDGVAVHAVPMSRKIQPVQDLVALVHLVRLCRRIKPDIVHLSTPKAALLGAIAATVVGVPVRVFVARGSISDSPRGIARWLNRLAEMLTAFLCHETIAVSPSLLEFLRTRGIVGKKRGRVIANGMSNGVAKVACSSTASHDNGDGGCGSTIGFVGRLGKEKGIAYLAAAWAQIRELHPDATLLLVGSWDADDNVSEQLKRFFETDTRVKNLGYVADVQAVYRRMSVLVFPSRREGFPNAPMEAAAMGVPTVGFHAVGTSDAVVDGVTGVLVEYGDTGGLVSGIQRYLLDEGLRKTHGRAARQRVEKDFQPEPIWQELARLYEDFNRVQHVNHRRPWRR